MSYLAYDIKILLPEVKKLPLGAPLPQGSLSYRLKSLDGFQDKQLYRISLPKKVCLSLHNKLPEFMPLEDLQGCLCRVQELGAQERALDLLNRKNYLLEEIQVRLLQEGYGEQATKKTLDFLKSYSLIDNDNYLRNFIEIKTRAGWGRKKIQLYLRNKGLKLETYRHIFEEILSEEQQYEKALSLLENKAYQHVSSYPKMYRYLAQKGYDHSIISRAISKYLESIS